ncbi:MAG TPA: ABC transporter ATP-binding protein [Candidatus Cloacimonetes bacterium]|nr:ABC transporter ATP-binding protein [Candidatus Cloacimonadota bacterium]
MNKMIDEHESLVKSFSVVNLSKSYGKFLALDDITFSLPQGRIVGLLGKNGAGKSTLMRCMLGFLRHKGTVSLDGEKVYHRDHRVFDKVAFIPDISGLDDRLTVQQSFDYVRRINYRFNDERGRRLISESGLPLNKKIGKLSKGMKTKLYLLLTLSLDVQYLFLDEPTLGLDIVFRKEFFNTILADFFDETKTIFISTHQVEEIENILQDILIIDEGKKILYDDIEALKDKYHIATVPASERAALEAHKPKVVMSHLSNVSAVLPSENLLEGASYARPGIADIFIEKVGGSNDSN